MVWGERAREPAVFLSRAEYVSVVLRSGAPVCCVLSKIPPPPARTPPRL
jgi:hypothetical protein